MNNRHALVGTLKNWESARAFQIDFLRRQGLQPHHYLLDFGCGTLRGGIPIIEYLDEGHYYGVDSRLEVLAEANRELREHGLEHKKPWLGENLWTNVEFDFIWCFSVFLHIEDDRFLSIIDGLASLITPEIINLSGRIFMNVNTHPVTPTHWGEFPVIWHPIEWYVEKAEQAGLATVFHGTLAALGYEAPDAESGAQEMLEFKL